MKKILAVLLSAAMVLQLTACNNAPDSERSDGSENILDIVESLTSDIVSAPVKELGIWDVLPEIPVTDESLFTYEDNDEFGGVTVTGYTGESLEVRIPDTLGGKPVVQVMLYDCDTPVTELIMPDSVKKMCLAEDFFRNSIIEYPHGLHKSLEYVNIPAGVVRLDCPAEYFDPDYMAGFDGDRFDTDKFTFWGFLNLKAAYISKGVQAVGDNNFSRCESLTNIFIPGSVTEIGMSAFSGCTSLEGVDIPDNVTDIGHGAFYQCESLKSVKIPDGVTVIYDNCFFGCSNLTSVDIPDSVTKIGPNAFACCTSLESITIGSGVTAFGDPSLGFSSGVFGLCDNLKEINVSRNNTKFCSFDGVLCEKDGEEISLIYCPFGRVGEIEIPKGATKIGSGAFSSRSNITSVTIPDGITEIEEGAFSGCSGLESVTIPSSVTKIGNKRGAFGRCESLTSATYRDKTYDYEHLKDLYAAINGGQ